MTQWQFGVCLRFGYFDVFNQNTRMKTYTCGSFTAWKEVEQKMGDGHGHGPHPDSSRGPVQYTEKTSSPLLKSEFYSRLVRMGVDNVLNLSVNHCTLLIVESL